MIITKECKHHGNTDFVREKNGYFRCKRCRNNHTIKRRQDVKLKLVDEFGGKCSICNYNKCIRNLIFHHLDPSQKNFGISAKGHTISYFRLKEEAKKCVLVCANCHGELHENLIKI